MSDVRKFVARLAMAKKGFKEINELTAAAYGDQAIHKTQIYLIIKKVKEGGDATDQRGKHREKSRRDATLIADIAAEVEKDGRVTIRKLAEGHGVSNDTIHKILHDDLGLSKKSARWVPKLLSKDQMQERVRVCKKFVTAVNRHSKAWLNNIVTMDETMVSLHTPETKKQ